jgi:voltage-gated potassium channel
MFKIIRNKNPRRLPLLLGFSLLLLLTIIGLLIWDEMMVVSERSSWEVLENAIITLMGEYPDKPTTVLGRILQLLLLVFGTLVFGTIVGKTSSLFVTRALAQEKFMKEFKNHVIICNWNDKASAIIHQIIKGNNGNAMDIVIVSAGSMENSKNFSNRNDVYFINGDPTHHETLSNLQATQAKSIILLADEHTVSPDEKNALIALAIKHLEQTPGHNTDIHVIAELVNLNLRRHLLDAGVDEIIAARDYSSGIIAQSAMFKNMSVVYQQLLTYSNDTNEFYFIPPGNYPNHFLGKTFRELTKLVNDAGTTNPDNPLMLVGVKLGNGEILLNPRPRDFSKLARDDSLIVMAFYYITHIDM